MTIRQLVATGLRLFAIWLCISALGSLVFMLKVKQANGLETTPAGGGYIVGFLLAFAVVVWVGSRGIAGAVTSGLAEPAAPPLSTVGLVMAGCALMGLWWLKEGIAALVITWLQAQTVASVSGQSAFASMDAATRAHAAYYVGEVALAGLFVSRPGIVARWMLGPSRASEPGDLTDGS